MFNFLENAQALKALYTVRKDKQILLSHAEIDLDARQLALTPADGWPGKNEEARSTARTKTFADDPVCKELAVKISGLRTDLATLDADILGAETDRRAGEWTEKQRYATILERHYMDTSPAPQAAAPAPAAPQGADDDAAPADALNDELPF